MKPSDYEGKTIEIDGYVMKVYNSCNPCYRLKARNEEFKFLIKWNPQTGVLTISKKEKCKLSLYQ